MTAVTPQDIKKIGNQLNKIINLKEWHAKAPGVMREGLMCKFTQIDHANKFLIVTTGEDPLAECNPYDNFWSCGLSMNDRRFKNKDTWPGKCILGQILHSVRTEIKDSTDM